jgi:hypothetical protein
VWRQSRSLPGRERREHRLEIQQSHVLAPLGFLACVAVERVRQAHAEPELSAHAGGRSANLMYYRVQANVLLTCALYPANCVTASLSQCL